MTTNNELLKQINSISNQDILEYMSFQLSFNNNCFIIDNSEISTKKDK
jgi:hypothetical protein